METPVNWEDILIGFLLIGVFLRGIILPALGKLTVKLLKEIFIRTERELALWNHFHQKGNNRSKR